LILVNATSDKRAAATAGVQDAMIVELRDVKRPRAARRLNGF